MPGIADILGLSGPPLAVFLLCFGTGKALEKRAPKRWKDAIRGALKKGTWFAFFDTIIASADVVLDRMFGTRLFSLRAVILSIMITISATTIVLLVVMGYSIWSQGIRYIDANVFMVIIVEVAWPSLKRMPIAIVADYITLVRVRYFCRNLRVSRDLLWKTVVSIALDFFTLYFVLLFSIWQSTHGTLLHALTYFFSSFQNFLEVPLWMLGFWNDPTEIVSLTGNTFASIIPSLVFYVYLITAISLRTVRKIFQPIAFVSRHLTFETPIADLGFVAGLILAGITSGFLFLVHHV